MAIVILVPLYLRAQFTLLSRNAEFSTKSFYLNLLRQTKVASRFPWKQIWNKQGIIAFNFLCLGKILTYHNLTKREWTIISGACFASLRMNPPVISSLMFWGKKIMRFSLSRVSGSVTKET